MNMHQPTQAENIESKVSNPHEHTPTWIHDNMCHTMVQAIKEKVYIFE
jgi:hypothetical protein